MPQLNHPHLLPPETRRVPRNLSLVSILSIGVLLVLSAGCAKIALPLPPEILVPTAAVDLTARQRADSVVLRVSLPRLNTNGTAVTTLRNVEVYRITEDAGGEKSAEQLSEDQFQRESELISSIPAAQLPDYVRQDFLFVEDSFPGMERSLVFSQTYRYAVLFVNKKNQAAGFSNQAVIAPVALPLPPEKVTAEIDETSINLKWVPPDENMDGSTPARISGYNIYRSTDPETQPTAPVNSDPLKNPGFKDVQFQFDSTYYYRVSVVGSIHDPIAESLLSESLEVTPQDVFPPLAVENFRAGFENEIMLLAWNPSPSPDVAGYIISRREAGAATEQRLHEGLITAQIYLDKNVLPGNRYSYSIIAVDAHGNKSSSVGVEAATQ